MKSILDSDLEDVFCMAILSEDGQRVESVKSIPTFAALQINLCRMGVIDSERARSGIVEHDSQSEWLRYLPTSKTTDH